MNIFFKIFGMSTRTKVIVFFLEHPIHSFTTYAIAEYLGLSSSSIRVILKQLRMSDIIEWCGTDRFDRWKLCLSNDVAKKFIDILTLDTGRRVDEIG